MSQAPQEPPAGPPDSPTSGPGGGRNPWAVGAAVAAVAALAIVLFLVLRPGDEDDSPDTTAAVQTTTPETTTEEATTEEATTEEATTDEAATEEPATEEAATEEETAGTVEIEAGTEVSVADITGLDVVTPEGEEIGEIDRILLVDGQPHVILQRGGFFGLGSDDVAVPAAQIEMRGEELILTGLGSEEFEALPEFEAESESELAAEDTVLIGASD